MNLVTSTATRIGINPSVQIRQRPAGWIQRGRMRANRVGRNWIWLTATLYATALTVAGIPIQGQSVSATVSLPASSGPVAVAVNPRTNKIYVADFYGSPNGITIIDGQTNATTSLTTIAGQTAVAVNPLTNKIYFVDAFNYLTVVDGLTDKVVATVTVGLDPVAVAVNPVTNKIYVANQTGSSVSVVDGNSNTVTATLGLAGGGLQGFVPSAIFVNPVTNQIYVTCQSADMLIDGATNTVSQLSYTGGLVNGGPLGIDLATSTIFAVNGGNSTVSVIDESTNALTTTVSSNLVAPLNITVNPVSNNAYVLNTLIDDVTVINGSSYATSLVNDTHANGPIAVAVNPSTNQVFVANSKSNNVTVINGSTYSTTLNVGTDPVAIAVNPVTNMVYVVNNSSSNVSVIAGAGTSQTIPITTAITPLSGNQTTSTTPTISFSATSTFAPVAPPVEAVYFQVDSQQGTWTQATSLGSGKFSGVTASLTSGSHTIYAFATDGQDSTSTVTGVQSGPLIGSIASYTFTEAGSGSSFSAVPSPLAFGNQTQGTTSSPRTLTITNTGATSLTINSVVENGSDLADFTVGSNTCNGAIVAAGKTCTVSVTFTPATQAAESAMLTFTDSATDSPQIVSLTGTGTAPVPTATTTTLSSSAASIAVGSSVTFTATVSPASGTPTPTGTVTFKDGSTTLGMGTLNSSGVATLSTSALAKGAHSITASYGGDTRNLASVSTSVAVTVTSAASTTTLTSSAASVVVGSSLTFTATVTGGTGGTAPTGTVTFKDGAATLGTGTVNSSGVATYATSALAAGSHSITASYGGDTNNAASVSSSVAVTIWPGPADFSMALTPTSGSFKAGKPATVTITVTSVNGFNSATNLACGSLPKNTVCKFSPASVTPSVSGSATSTLTIDTDTKPTTTARAGQPSEPLSGNARFQRAAFAAGTTLALILFPLFGTRNRKLRRLLLSLSCLGLLSVIALGGLTACGGGPTTPKGTYSISITATSGSTTHTATYSLTVQ